MMKNSLLFCAGLLLLAGCASEPAKKIHTPGYGEVAAGHKFEKIRDARLELVFVGPKTMKAGQKHSLCLSSIVSKAHPSESIPTRKSAFFLNSIVMRSRE